MKPSLLISTLMLALVASPSTGVSATDEEAGIVLAVGDIARCELTWKQQSAEWLNATLGANVARLVFGPEADEPKPLSQAKVTAQLIERLDGVVLGLGDLAYWEGTVDQFENCFNQLWGTVVDRVRPVVGNHEYKSEATGYKTFFGSRAAEPHFFYSFDVGGWHLVALNSVIDASAGSEQARWLEGDLAANKGKCTLAFFHHPAYSSTIRGDGNRFARQIFSVLYDWNVTLAVTGHDHLYERIMPLDDRGEIDVDRGIRQFVVGTGGVGFEERPVPRAFSEKLITHQYGVLRMKLLPDSYEWEFLAAPSGEVLDRGAGGCRKASNPGP